MKIDGGENVCQLRLNNIKSGMKLDFITRDVGINLELLGCIDEEFLKYLEGDDSSPMKFML